MKRRDDRADIGIELDVLDFFAERLKIASKVSYSGSLWLDSSGSYSWSESSNLDFSG
jgi:hypothetical protein